MKKVSLFLVLFLCICQAKAQDFTYQVKSASKVKVFTFYDEVELQGHSGKEIIVMGEGNTIPDQAKGLRLISNDNIQDNTNGLGVNIEESEGTVNIRNVGHKVSGKRIIIKIPEQMPLHVVSKGYNAHQIIISDFKKDIEVNSEYAEIKINNVNGPLLLTSTYGDVKVVFAKLNLDKPCSLVATYNNLDVTLPADTKANLKLSSQYGNVYTDFELEKVADSNNAGYENLNSSQVLSKINGGGVEILMSSPYNNVYLRKSK